MKRQRDRHLLTTKVSRRIAMKTRTMVWPQRGAKRVALDLAQRALSGK
jgi:hypothetical protein